MLAAMAIAVLVHVLVLAATVSSVLGMASKKDPPRLAKGVVRLRCVQPKSTIKQFFPNSYQSSDVVACTMIGKKTRSVNGKEIACYTIEMDSVTRADESGVLRPRELYVSCRYFTADKLSAEQKKQPSVTSDDVILLDGDAAEAVQLNPQWSPAEPTTPNHDHEGDGAGNSDGEAAAAAMLEEAYADDKLPLPENVPGY